MIEPTIQDLIKPIEKELEQFQREFENALHSDIELINTISHYIVSQEGKKIRPSLLLLSARLCGQPNNDSYIAASLVEILHTATLVHDDIVDESEERRGQPSVKALWKNKVSVLLGDYLFSKSLRSMLRLKNFEALEMLSETSELLSSGELLQLGKSYTNGMDEDIYYRMIWAKTASLFATACKLGGMTVGADSGKTEKLWLYGKYLGIAFQIKDDLLDFTGSKKDIGKPIGRDIKANLITLPLLYTMQKLPPREGQRLRKLIRSDLNEEEIARVNSLIAVQGGLDYTRQVLDRFSKQALEQLDMFPDSEIKECLCGFVLFNQKRLN